ncbi:M1 family metallopeptidase [Flavipsychrobacter stenotrophus]|uniref:M1 family metallopeptidase n=1 Tax=Flavipsychrobacter stenotrophus TaxID=2077091 RepID=UPI001374E72A|nr:M1 family metallopeptidase [Flavipsychrobacter stenotrophus]
MSFLLCADLSHAQRRHRRSANADTVQRVMLDTLEITAKAGKPPYQPSAPKLWEINNTRVALSFNWKEKTADVKEWISLHPYFYASDSIVLDAKGMQIDSVELVTKTGNKRLQYSYNDDRLSVHFDRFYISADSVTLYLKYKAMPYAKQSGGSAAIVDDKGLYFINTDGKIPHKPSQIWTQGETESNSHWMITLDKPNTKFTSQIELTVPDTMTTLSNGALIKQVKGTNGMRTDIWKQDMRIQAYAVMFAIGKFSIIKDKWKDKEVNYYVEPEFAPYARQMFNNTGEMMDYYSQITGVSYPWNKYSQVVVRDYVSGAMENTTASLFGDFMNQTTREIADKNSEDVVSHELFHQWFGDYVTAESWTNVTVNESFANYGEQLWRRHKYGKDAGDELAWNDLMGYVYSSSLKDPQLVRFNYDSREEVFDAISYNKGGAILHYLNTLIGDDAFNRSMKIYLTKNALGTGEAHSWRMAVEEATGQDWNWFFNQFYFHAGHPLLKVNYNYDDSANKLTVIVNQAQSDSMMDYTLPLKTAVIYGDQKTVIDWNINKRKDTFIFAYKNGVKPVIIPDCQHVLPGEIKENKRSAPWLIQYRTADDYVSRRLAIGGAGKSMSDSSAQELLTFALSDANGTLRRFTLSQMEKAQSDKYRRRWTPKIVEMAKSDNDKLVRSDAIDVLGSWKVTTAKGIMMDALYDSSYAVAGSALEALAEIDADTAYMMAKKLSLTQPRASLQSVIWNIVGKNGKEEDAAYFEAQAPYVQGTKKFALARGMSSYLKHVKSDESFIRITNSFTDVIVLESMKSYRGSLGGFFFQVAAEQKENIKSDKPEEAASATKRLAIVKAAIEKVIAAEDDAEQLDDYKKMMKETFEKE